ncbi:amidase [Falsiroseomonas oryzae]|uniref:amidase n=1 Tax=Falsiroseomonas oryzae TaxID=2766473 RepID=UPI0022EA8D8F|nr:amidase family protein [Roseomonas sp. MO-31]
MTEPCDLSAVEARRRIGARQLSPVELVESCLARIGQVNHAVNAVVALDAERALAAAKAAEAAVMRGEALGPLHGLPLGIKDLDETAGLRTTWGSALFADHVPAKDGRFVASIRRAGGIVLGKTNTPEFGSGANTRNVVYGATGNAFDPTKNAAGSSGGSAVALATGMMPLCTGSDTGGSLRNPAAFNGIFGFRPSPGLVPSERRSIGWAPISVLGPMARRAEDCALMLSAVAGDDPVDPLAYTLHGRAVRGGDPALFPPARLDLAGLRVAATPDFGFAPVESQIREVFAKRVADLEPLFGRVAFASPDCAGTDEAFEVLRAAEYLATHLEKLQRAPDKVGPNVRANLEEAQRYGLGDYARAAAAQTRIYRGWQRFFADHDLLISPAITISPRSWRELYPKEIDGQPTRTYFHWLSLAYAVSLVGHPACSLPLGRDQAGMPFGLQIVGPRGGDALVLAAAAAIEAAVAGDAALSRPVPDIAALKAARPISEMPEFLTMN